MKRLKTYKKTVNFCKVSIFCLDCGSNCLDIIGKGKVQCFTCGKIVAFPTNEFGVVRNFKKHKKNEMHDVCNALLYHAKNSLNEKTIIP